MRDADGPKLQRHIGKWELCFIAISSVIGSGWLFSALYAAQYAGPAAIVAWIAGGIVVMLFALIYSELGTLFPEAGGLARYPMYSHGRLVSFYGSFAAWLAYVATAPIEVMAVVEYMAEFLPWVERTQDGDVVLTGAGVALSLVMLLGFCVVNLVGVRWLTRANNVIVVWKLVVPLTAALALMATRFEVSNFTDAGDGGFAPFGLGGIATALSAGGVMFAFLGFRAAIEMAGEVDDPQRSIPFALIVGLTACIVIYLLLQVAFIGALSPGDLAQGWDTNGVLLLGVLGGFVLAFTMYGFSGPEERARWDLRSGLWLAPYLIAMALVSYAGNFGNGRGLLPGGWDTAIVAIISVPLFWLALRGGKAVVEIAEDEEQAVVGP